MPKLVEMQTFAVLAQMINLLPSADEAADTPPILDVVQIPPELEEI